MQRSVRFVTLILLVVPLLAACGSTGEEGITVENAWVRPAPMVGGNGGGFMVIKNTGAEDDALVSAEADFANVVEIHETYMIEEGEGMEDMGGQGEDEGMGESMEGMSEMMGMRPVSAIVVPAGGEIELKPGSYHVMFIDVQEVLEPDATVSITLNFESGKQMVIEAEVQAR